jgi:two-component system OmpR family sensor kinase
VDVAPARRRGPFIEVCDSAREFRSKSGRVFDRFYRRAQADGPGSGLGLAIVKTIADRHRARVLLDDAALVACARALNSLAAGPLSPI